MKRSNSVLVAVIQGLLGNNTTLDPDERPRRLRLAAAILIQHDRPELVQLVCDVMGLSPDTMRAIMREIARD